MANEFIARRGIISLEGAQITGSLSVTSAISASSLTVTGNITGAGTSAFATTGSNRFNGNQIVTGSFTVTTGSAVEFQVTNTGVNIGNVSTDSHNTTGSLRVSGSATIVGNTIMTGSLTVTGQIIAQTLNVQQVTSSIVYSSGSNVFGNSLSNTQQLTGSVSVTGSLAVNGAGTFASSVTATANTSGRSGFFGGTSFGLRIDNSGSFNNGGSIIHGVDNTFVASYQKLSLNGSSLEFMTDYGTKLTIANSGTATFTSGVTATSFEVGNGQFFKARRSSSNLLIDLLGIESGTDNTRLLITGDFNIKNGSLSTLFNMTTTGAATFSNTVTATGNVRSINTGVDGTFADAFVGVYNVNNNEQNAIQTSVSSAANVSGFRFQASNGGGSSGRTTVVDFLRDRQLFYTNVGIGTTNPTYRTEVALSISAYWNGTAFTGGNPTALSINNTTNGGYDSVLLLQQTDSGGTTKLAGGIGLVGRGPWTAGNNATQISDMYFLVRNDSGGISERLRITSGGNVGIGTTTPSELLTIASGGKIATFRSGNDRRGVFYTDSSATWLESDTTGNDPLALKAPGSSANILFYISTTERMRITSDGYLGIGTGATTINNGDLIGLLAFRSNDTSTNSSGAIGSIRSYATADYNTGGVSGDLRFYTQDGGQPNGALLSGAERVRITSGGDVLVGQTSLSLSANGWALQQGGTGHASFQITNNEAFVFNNRTTGTTAQIDFRTNTIERGAINITDSGVTYTSVSDYRIKEDLQPINGLEKVNAIKVYNFKFKETGTRTDGVLAHELQEVLPYAVQGEKDGRKLQGVDYSKIVPVLVKAVQELKSENDALKEILQRNNIS